MDGFAVANARTASDTTKLWAHTDQGTLQYPFECIQGQLTLFDCLDPKNDGGLVVWEGSHLAHKRFFELHPEIKVKGNWHKFDEAYIQEIERDGGRYLEEKAEKPRPMPRVHVTAKAGSVILWKSTTTHQNRPPQPGGQPRAVIYVCYAEKQYMKNPGPRFTKSGKPRARPKLGDLEARKQAFERRLMTAHWPVLHFHTFSARPHFYSKDDADRWEKYWAKNDLNTKEVKFTELGLSLLA
jgi:ectoine hydroxylase-related dioxygenase (phytanoyl-CoA dioxygenase family)